MDACLFHAAILSDLNTFLHPVWTNLPVVIHSCLEY